MSLRILSATRLEGIVPQPFQPYPNMTRDQKIYRVSFGIAAGILAITFLMGSYKLFYPEQFERAVRDFQMLPDILVRPVALVIPWLEISCVVLVLIPQTRTGALWIMIAMLTVFTLAMSMSLLHGAEISCGCFSYGDTGEPVGWASAGRNVALIVLAGLALAAKRRM